MSLAINSRYLTEEFMKSEGRDDGKMECGSLIQLYHPFRCFALPDFVDYASYNCRGELSSSSSCVPKYEKTYLSVLRDELEVLELHEKKNDLYNFRQSDDLHNINTPAINAFKDLFSGPVKEWLQRLTGIDLHVRVALTASAYGRTDHLLCHDDELENRRIAFAFYLTPDWSESDGGRLDLFASDEHLRPTNVTKSIVPCENVLSLFEVVPCSFHQVSEVRSVKKTRWSINGWFHGATIQRPLPLPDPPAKRFEPCSVEFDDLLAWINPDYVDPETQASIREQFEDKSEIQLYQFLQMERYEAVMAELEKCEMDWQRRGPWNRRNYFVCNTVQNLDQDRFPNLSFCIRLMHSEAMYVLLSQFSNMRLHPLYQEDDDNADEDGEIEYVPPAKKQASNENGESSGTGNNDCQSDQADLETSPCELELRKFEPGCYTLLSDADFTTRASSGEGFALDAQLCFTLCDWDTRQGGYTCYVEKDSSEELLTVVPRGNSLALVCSESGTQRFVKYINQNAMHDFGKSGKPSLVDISAVYFEARRSGGKNGGDGNA